MISSYLGRGEFLTVSKFNWRNNFKKPLYLNLLNNVVTRLIFSRFISSRIFIFLVKISWLHIRFLDWKGNWILLLCETEERYQEVFTYWKTGWIEQHFSFSTHWMKNHSCSSQPEIKTAVRSSKIEFTGLSEGTF